MGRAASALPWFENTIGIDFALETIKKGLTRRCGRFSGVVSTMKRMGGQTRALAALCGRQSATCSSGSTRRDSK